MTKKAEQTTHFGYQQVPENDKVKRVADVFHSVADNYDIMNDLMSFGVHRIWKRKTVLLANLRPGMKVLDLASGTGDLAKLMTKHVGDTGHIVLSDINESMLSNGRARLLDNNITENVSFALANAEDLPFPKNSFDRITIAFGLRNVTHKEKALASMYQSLKPGGMALILEFSKPTIPALNPIYDAYSFHILPKIGKLIADDADSYQYLAESIRMHPCQETLKDMMQTAGFEDCTYHNFTAGVVALHIGYKY